MFEEMTYERILKQMLDRVPAAMDKRQGSIIYDALAPAAVELQIMYISLDNTLRETFGDTADREYLVKRAAEHGIEPYMAKAAEWKAVLNPVELVISSGERFRHESVYFQVLEKTGDGEYRMVCETAGVEGNGCYGELIPVNYIEGLQGAQLTELVTPGNDEENTEAFRERFLSAVRKPSSSGNVYDYYNWALECGGVGAVKVIPLAQGPGSVKVVITDENRAAAGAALVESVWDYIEKRRPIGALVTVIPAVEKVINVSAHLRLKQGFNLGFVQEAFQANLTEFFSKNAFHISYVSVARVGNLLLSTDGIEDVADLALNDAVEHVSLGIEEIAIVGDVRLEVMG